MCPAFSTNRGAAAFAILLLVCLLLPLMLVKIGLPPRSEFYQGIPQQAGPFVYLAHEIYEEKSDIDILFFGNSLLRVAIDDGYVRQALTQLGREANTPVCGFSWQGYDLQYYVLRDLLEHRKVKMLVLAMPTERENSSKPHVQLYRVVRYGDFPHTTDGLSLTSKLGIYGEMVLGSPRQVLNLLRPNLHSSDLALHSSRDSLHNREIGYNGTPFVRHLINPPQIPPESMIFSPETRSQFDFRGSPVNQYQLHFIKEIGELARRHGVLLVILHVPLASERGSTTIHERMLWPDVLGDDAAVVGVTSANLFQGISDGQVYDFYEDEHLNRNGQELFTRTITPALVSLYVEHFGKENREYQFRLTAERGATVPLRVPADSARTRRLSGH